MVVVPGTQEGLGQAEVAEPADVHPVDQRCEQSINLVIGDRFFQLRQDFVLLLGGAGINEDPRLDLLLREELQQFGIQTPVVSQPFLGDQTVPIVNAHPLQLLRPIANECAQPLSAFNEPFIGQCRQGGVNGEIVGAPKLRQFLHGGEAVAAFQNPGLNHSAQLTRDLGVKGLPPFLGERELCQSFGVEFLHGGRPSMGQ